MEAGGRRSDGPAPCRPGGAARRGAERYQLAKAFDTGALIARLTERAAFAEAKAAQFDALLKGMRGERPEEEFLLRGERIGPYLTCRRGLVFERANRDWCREAVAVLRARSA